MSTEAAPNARRSKPKAVEEITTKAAFLPASIPMPDHLIRQSKWWQMYSRLARPTHDWIVACGVGWALVLGPVNNLLLPELYLIQVLVYAGGTFGIRTFEKIRGVA